MDKENVGLSTEFINSVNTAFDAVAPKSSMTTTNIEENLRIFYDKLETLGFDLEELKPILEAKSDLLILAGAGSGKTTALILKIIRDFISGDALKPTVVPQANGMGETTVLTPVRILVGTFLKTGAEELKESFFTWCRRLGVTGISSSSIQFCTLHKEFMDAIKSFGGTVQIAEENVINSIVRNLMHKYNVHQRGTSAKVTIEEINDIKGLFTYCRNRLDDAKYQHPLFNEYNIDSTILTRMLTEYNVNLDVQGVLDFEATQELLYKYLQINPHIRQGLASRYDFVFVDEFQDISQLQYEILRPYFEGAMRKIVIGDDDQTIYSWRGSDIEIITHRYEEDYHPTVLPLTLNHRCPNTILTPVVPSIMLNENRHPKRLRSAKEGGVVDVMFNVTTDQFISAVNTDLTKYDTIGIVSRTNNDLLIPAIVLEMGCGVDYQTSKSVSLKAKMPVSICSAIDLVTKRYTENFSTILRNIFPRYFEFEIDTICRILSGNEGYMLHTLPDEDIAASVPNLTPFIRGLRKARETGEIAAFIYVLEYMVKQTFAKETNYCRKARTFALFIKDLITSKATENMDIYAIDRLLNNELPGRISKRNSPTGNPRIKLTTVHEAKGKEWDSVIIWNDIDGTFPSALSRETNPLEYEEERRLHYIAWTRAKQHLLVCSDTSNPSPFLAECRLPNISVEGCTSSVVSQQTINQAGIDIPGFTKAYLTQVLNKESTVSAEDMENMDICLAVASFEQICSAVADAIKTGYINKNITTAVVSSVLDGLAYEASEALEVM